MPTRHVRLLILGSGPAGYTAAVGRGYSDDELSVHRYVDRDSGLEALLDAVTANIGGASA